MNMKPSIAIVGCGKVGTSLGIYLAEAGINWQVVQVKVCYLQEGLLEF